MGVREGKGGKPEDNEEKDDRLGDHVAQGHFRSDPPVSGDGCIDGGDQRGPGRKGPRQADHEPEEKGLEYVIHEKNPPGG
jgi:hypothetical protein